jgi:hypothetical protein
VGTVDFQDLIHCQITLSLVRRPDLAGVRRFRAKPPSTGFSSAIVNLQITLAVALMQASSCPTASRPLRPSRANAGAPETGRDAREALS